MRTCLNAGLSPSAGSYFSSVRWCLQFTSYILLLSLSLSYILHAHTSCCNTIHPQQSTHTRRLSRTIPHILLYRNNGGSVKAKRYFLLCWSHNINDDNNYSNNNNNNGGGGDPSNPPTNRQSRRKNWFHSNRSRTWKIKLPNWMFHCKSSNTRVILYYGSTDVNEGAKVVTEAKFSCCRW